MQHSSLILSIDFVGVVVMSVMGGEGKGVGSLLRRGMGRYGCRNPLGKVSVSTLSVFLRQHLLLFSEF